MYDGYFQPTKKSEIFYKPLHSIYQHKFNDKGYILKHWKFLHHLLYRFTI